MMDCGLMVKGESKLCNKTISRKCAVRYSSNFHFQKDGDISAGDRRIQASVYSVWGRKAVKTQGWKQCLGGESEIREDDESGQSKGVQTEV